jgi:hypothetical protein
MTAAHVSLAILAVGVLLALAVLARGWWVTAHPAFPDRPSRDDERSAVKVRAPLAIEAGRR